MLKRIGLIGLGVVLAGSYVLAETVRLKDGTLLEGVVIKQGTKYWIKTKEGDSRTVDATEVAAIGAEATKGTTTVKPGEKTAPATGGSEFLNTKSKADRAEQAVVAVQLWEAYIETKPSPADLELSKAELERWQKYQKENYEKINGKWIGGDELKKNRKQVADLVKDAQKSLTGSSMLQGVKSLEQALKLDPNNFEANFTLGYIYLLKGGTSSPPNLESIDKAIKVLETTAKIDPNDASTLSNLAIGYNFRQKYEQAVLTAYKAVQMEDNKGTVTNLLATLSYAPPNMRENNSKVRPIVDEAKLLAGRYGIAKAAGFVYMPPTGRSSAVAGEKDQRKGLVWMGSGFFVTPDGYFLTNRHVATGQPDGQVQADLSFRCRFDDGIEKNCELVAIDEKWDIALMRVKTDDPVPYLKIVDRNPNPAAHALVLGYPATGADNPTMQVASGAVKSVNPDDMHQVWFDLSTTHGNSGGPIVDRSGYVMGILTGGRTVSNVTYVLGIGPMQIKKFFENIGAKAPSTVQYAPPGTAEFDGEKLAIEARKSTLLVMAIRGSEKATKKTPEKE